jgi:hypothetical protein
LGIKTSQGKSAALLKDQSSATTIAVKPNQVHALRLKFVDNWQAVDWKAPVKSNSLVVPLKPRNKLLSRRIPYRLEFRMRPAVRMALKVVVRETMLTGQISSEGAFSGRWYAGKENQALFWNRHLPP